MEIGKDDLEHKKTPLGTTLTTLCLNALRIVAVWRVAGDTSAALCKLFQTIPNCFNITGANASELKDPLP